MKNPNGYGSVYKLSGKRRNPFIVRKTINWSIEGKQQYQTIGFYSTRSEALMALAEFNKNPYSIESSVATFSSVYNEWKKYKFDTVSRSSINGYEAAYEICKPLHEIKFTKIRSKHMQDIIINTNRGHGTKRKIKVLFNQLFKFSMENDIISKDYSKYVDIGTNQEENKRTAFSETEILKLFSVVDKIEFVDSILIMIFTGLRIGELLLIKTIDINIENQTITGGIKTDAGKNRIIPISNKIIDLIKKRINNKNEFLISNLKGRPLKYSNYYRGKFAPIMELLNMNHKPHDCRHTFATLMSNAGANTIALQKIIGHASYQTTANIYTHKDIVELKKAIDLL